MRAVSLLAVYFIVALSAFPAFAKDIHMYAGAGLREPTQEIVEKFEKATGHKVSIEYGGMGQLLSRFKMTGEGDLILSGSENYIQQLGDKVLLSYPLVKHTAVMALLKSKATGIDSFEKLANSSLKLGMGDSKAIALGKSGEKLLELSGYGPQLESKVLVRASTIKQLLMYLLNGDVDAAVISRTDAIKYEKKLLILPSPAGTPEEVSVIAVLSTSAHSDIAKELAIFFKSPESQKIFVKHGFLLAGE